MSFQTFCGQDPNDAVSYRKVLPQFIAENSATTSVVRINNAGAYSLRKPSIMNEALTIVETYSQGKAGFSVDVLPNPPEDPNTRLNTTGCLPYKNGQETGYLVYGGDTGVSGVLNRGQIFKYVPNVANPSAGVWELLAETEDANPAVVLSGCQLNPTIANGGEPADGALFVFCGVWTQMEPTAGHGAVVAAPNFVVYNSATEQFSALPFAHPVNFFAADVFGIPATLAAVGTLIMLGGAADSEINYNGNNYGYTAIYTPTGGGDLKYIGGNAGDTIGSPNTNEPLWCNFDNLDRLWVGGQFSQATIAGNVIAQPYLICLSAAAGTFSNNVPIPNLKIGQGNTGAAIQFISNSYADGSKILICGGGTFNDSSGIKRNAFGVIDTAALTITQPASFNSQPAAADIAQAALYIDDNNYVVSAAFVPDGFNMWGVGNGSALTKFAQGLIGTFYDGLDWYFEGIAAGKPVSYIAFNYRQGSEEAKDENNAFSGSYSDAATTSSLVLQNGAVFRHIAASGAYKDAPTATINTQFATLSLIGDTAANAWDVVGYTGTITFNDAP